MLGSIVHALGAYTQRTRMDITRPYHSCCQKHHVSSVSPSTAEDIAITPWGVAGLSALYNLALASVAWNSELNGKSYVQNLFNDSEMKIPEQTGKCFAILPSPNCQTLANSFRKSKKKKVGLEITLTQNVESVATGYATVTLARKNNAREKTPTNQKWYTHISYLRHPFGRFIQM